MKYLKGMLRWGFGLAVGLLLLLLSSLSQCQAQVTDKYDKYFRDSARHYLWGLLPDDDWRWWKAQCYQESRLNRFVVSPAGASGICQLMPDAAQDAELPWIQRYNAAKNIQAGAKILRRNIKLWWLRDTRFQRLQLGWAGYNAGAGRILQAQVDCNEGRLWEDIEPCVSFKETRDYVRIIPKHYKMLTNVE